MGKPPRWENTLYLCTDDALDNMLAETGAAIVEAFRASRYTAARSECSVRLSLLAEKERRCTMKR